MKTFGELTRAERGADVTQHIIKICWKCCGTGFRVASAQPLKFKFCNKCCGRGGKTKG